MKRRADRTERMRSTELQKYSLAEEQKRVKNEERCVVQIKRGTVKE